MNKYFNMLSDEYISDDVKGMIFQSSKIKKEIFNAVLRSERMDPQTASTYLSFINSLLLKWEEIGNVIKDSAEKIDGNIVLNTSTTVMDYNDAKQYIYASYDYASVLQFIDGVIKMNSKDDTDADDIDDYFESVIDKAFKERATTVAGALNEVLSANTSFNNASKSDTSLYNTAKKYKAIDTKHRVELYKAITKSVEFLGNEKNINKYFKIPEGYDNTNLFIQSVFDSVEYITYSVTAYITRIYALWNYYGRYIMATPSTATIVPLPESKEISVPDIGKERLDLEEVNVLREYEDDKIKSFKYNKETINIFESFITLIGAANMLVLADGHSDIKQISDYHILHNSYSDKLEGNDLFKFIVTGGMLSDINYNQSDSDIELIAFHDRLKDLVYNAKQGLLDTNSPKQELLQVIRGTNYELKTTECCKKDGVDLYKFALQVLNQLENMIQRAIRHHTTSSDPKGFDPFTHDTTMASLSTDTIRILSDTYSEIAIAIFEKGRDIERKFNSVKVTEKDKLMNNFKLNIGSDDKNTTKNINNAVPDTTRMPMDLTNLYKIPSYESAAAYDEFLMETNSLYREAFYYTEGIDFTKAKNTIVSIVKGIIASIKDFFNNASFKKAVKWVQENGKKVQGMNFAGKEMEVWPYKVSIVNGTETESIDINAPYKSITEGLKAFNINNIKTMDDVAKFGKSLYPDEETYTSFKNDTNAPLKFYNTILFGKEFVQKNPNGIPKKKISGAEINTHVGYWVSTVAAADQLYSDVGKKNDEISKSIDNIHTQLASYVNNLKNQNKNNQQSTSSTTNTNTNNTNNNQTTTQPPKIDQTNNQQNHQNNNVKEAVKESVWFEDGDNNNMNNADGESIVNAIENEIRGAMQNLYVNMKNLIFDYFKTEYGYIQEAYRLGSQQNNQNNNQNNNQ